MITYRISTQPPPEPPVRLYKIIAISFLVITVVLLGLVIFMTSKKTTIIIVAKQDTRNIDVVAKVSKNADDTNALFGAVTSTLFAWSEQFQPTGDKTVEGVSRGEVVLYNKMATNQPLVKTTRLVTSAGVLFHLVDHVTVPAHGQKIAAVYADKPGKAFDIGPSQFVIPGLAVDKQKIVYAESLQPMQGGEAKVGVLSAADVTAAKASYSDKVKAVFLKMAAPNATVADAPFISITNQAVVTNHQPGEEVSTFTVSGTSTIVMISYDHQQLAQLLDRAVSEKVDLATEKFLSVDAEPQVTVTNFDAKAGTAEFTIHQAVAVTLDANVDTLSPQHFLGKKKDEIERYVMGLDHVSGVEVQFTPSWMLSAPSVVDRIKVVVKNVQ